MFEFGNLWAWLMLPLPILFALGLRPAKLQQSALKVPYFDAIKGGSERSTRRGRNLVLLSLIWLLLVAAAARPQWYGEVISQPASARDLLLAVDISGSMESPDMVVNNRQVTRIAVVKAVVDQFIQRRTGDRLGLVLFGSRAYMQSPLTFDRKTVGTLLREAQIGFAGQGTAIGDAIGLATRRLVKRPAEQRVLILLTDGANSAGEVPPLKAAELAKQSGVKVYTIGVGAEEFSRPGLFGSNFMSRRINPSADLDEETLRKIADITGGQYFRARDPQELQQIYLELDKLEPMEQEAAQFRPVVSLYSYPLAAAVLLAIAWLVSPLLRSRLNAWQNPAGRHEVTNG